MGADLYIEDMDRDGQMLGFEVSDRAIENGYFRDCYNSYGLFNFLRSNTDRDYSWWAMVEEDELFDKNQKDGLRMTPAGAKTFLKRMKAAKALVQHRKDFVLSTYNWDKKEEETTKLKKKEVKEYMDWLDKLIRFLELAIEKKSRIIFSV